MLVLIILVVVMAVASPAFLSVANIANLLEQWAPIGIMAVAGTVVIIAGGFDLSSSAMYAASGVVAAMTANATGSSVIGIATGILTGLGLGLFNGVVVTVGRVNPFMTTLATSLMIRGIITAISAGALISVLNVSFTNLGLGTKFALGWSVWIFAAVVVVLTLLMRYTVFGRHVYAVGGIPTAARLSGVRIGLVQASTFAISGLACGIAGVIIASRGASASAGQGLGLELTVIAAIVIGGTSILGGEGAIWRTVVGVLLLAVIGNGFNLLGVEPVYRTSSRAWSSSSPSPPTRGPDKPEHRPDEPAPFPELPTSPSLRTLQVRNQENDPPTCQTPSSRSGSAVLPRPVDRLRQQSSQQQPVKRRWRRCRQTNRLHGPRRAKHLHPIRV